MALTPAQAVKQAPILFEYHQAEREELNVVRRYWKGRQRLPAVIPVGAPSEVRVMERSSRVNVMPIVVNSLVQSSFIDGFRAAKDEQDDLEVWGAWQKNRMDKRQSGIYRAAAAYGAAYAVVLPGDPVPVIRGASPRSMTTLYGEDPDWPMWGFERLGYGLFKIYDEDGCYHVRQNDRATEGWDFIEAQMHGLGFTPIIRFLDEEDLDDEDEVEPESQRVDEASGVTRGQIAPLMPIQDQIDLTTFDLQIAQHYGAFKQRYIIGWAADSEREALKTSAMKFLTIDDDEPEKIKVGQFDQTDISGFIESREASLRHGATLSQTPVHELTGQLVNLSAEALAAAEAGRDRKVGERHTNWGESAEQVFWTVGKIQGQEIPDDAQVVWRDTSARSFAATVDALGKLATMLGIPPQELWERVPGVTKQDVERYKAAAASGDAFDRLADLLEVQGANGNGNGQ